MNYRSFFRGKQNRLQKRRVVDDILFVVAILGFIAVFVDVGGVNSEWHRTFDVFYHVCLFIFLLLFSLRAYLDRFIFNKKRDRWLSILEVIFILIMFVAESGVFLLESLDSRDFLQLGISFIFLVEISRRSLALERLNVNPPLLFIFSFVLLILIGTFALMLPISTYKGLGFLDSLFTSTSAVCVTGLAVVDTGTYFTRFGQNVILTLISLGGLGVMTFTSFFGFFFRGETTFRNQMIYKDFTGEENIRNVFSTISKIVTLTIGVELVGATILFFSLKPGDIEGGLGERIYFSLFHSISAFNNAGFQLRADGLYDTVLRWNYPFQIVIAMLIIFGGLGFPISFNLVRYFRQRIKARIRQWIHLEPYRFQPWIINLNTKIVLWTTTILLVFGTVMFYFTEMGKSLGEHSGISKWLIAFFCSVTTRTAGFNNINMAELTHEGIMITLLLMWIGASPSSTGGGIKTTTIAVATLGILNIARGRKHIEVDKREIAMDSILRAFIIISLSLIALDVATFAVVSFEEDMPLEKIVFECFSAYGTVGLSLGITPLLSDLSKSVIILTMFIGRVGALTILLGILKQVNTAKLYSYPEENVTIT